MKLQLPRQHEAAALALPYVGIGLNLLLVLLLPIGLMLQCINKRYFFMVQSKNLTYSILLTAPVVSIPSFIVFDFLFTWKADIMLVALTIVSATLVSTLICYQLLRIAEMQLTLANLKEQQ